MSTRARRPLFYQQPSRIGLLAGAATVSATLLVLMWAGAPSRSPTGVPTPPLTEPARWAAWATDHGAPAATFGLIRVAAIAVAVYLLLTIGIGLLARALRLSSLARAVDRVTLPALRRFTAAVVTAGVAGSQLGVATMALAPGRAAAVTAQASASESGPFPTQATPATIVMRRLTAAYDAGATAGAAVPGSDIGASTSDGAGANQADAPGAWTVQPGQCFWTIAVEVLAGRHGAVPSDVEIVPYWLRLIEANRSALADPDNPDLIFPAQVFAIPPEL